MKTHEVKSWLEFFEPVYDGTKNFELRKNDRGYAVGDVIILREWDPNTETYTGRKCARRIAYCMNGIGSAGTIAPYHGLSIGYVILGLRNEEPEQDESKH
jgi:Domain of unknown function (DUF3850)